MRNGKAKERAGRRKATPATWAGRGLIGLSGLLCGGLWLAYAYRPDAVAALDAWPAWSWLVPGWLLLALAWLVGHRAKGWRARWALLAVGVWLAFMAAQAEEPASLLRGWTGKPVKAKTIRLVTLNCGTDDPVGAARSVMAHKPDLVLLQEAPDPASVAQLARQLYGREAGCAHQLDRAVLARGNVRLHAPAGRKIPFAYMRATVELRGGPQVEVFNVHLLPPVMDFNLLRPQCWADHRHLAGSHRQQVAEVAAAVRALPPESLVVAAGDWNMPQGAGPLRQLSPLLHDAAVEGGQGWGNTVLGDFPVLRFDQVWLSSRLRAYRVVARQTISDHRLVVAELTRAGGNR